MRRSRRLHGFTFALLVGSGACSLRSLDYLENGEASAGAAAITSGTTSKETGGSGGDLGGRAGAGGKAGAGGTNGGNAGSSSNGGTGTAGSTSGAGGTAGSTGGGSGGTVDPAGGNDAGGSDAGGADTGGAGSDGGGAGEAGAPSCTPGDSGCPPTVAPEVPYVLRPGHALSKCADVDGFSVVNGGSVIQYSCYNQSNQVFWAEDHGEGRLAFRNALSGKCLSVEGRASRRTRASSSGRAPAAKISSFCPSLPTAIWSSSSRNTPSSCSTSPATRRPKTYACSYRTPTTAALT